MLWDAECKDETPPPPPAGAFLFFTRKLYKILHDSAEAASAFMPLGMRTTTKQSYFRVFIPMPPISQPDTPDVSNEVNLSLRFSAQRDFYLTTLSEAPHWSALC